MQAGELVLGSLSPWLGPAPHAFLPQVSRLRLLTSFYVLWAPKHPCAGPCLQVPTCRGSAWWWGIIGPDSNPELEPHSVGPHCTLGLGVLHPLLPWPRHCCYCPLLVPQPIPSLWNAGDLAPRLHIPQACPALPSLTMPRVWGCGRGPGAP